MDKKKAGRYVIVFTLINLAWCLILLILKKGAVFGEEKGIDLLFEMDAISAVQRSSYIIWYLLTASAVIMLVLFIIMKKRNILYAYFGVMASQAIIGFASGKIDVDGISIDLISKMFPIITGVLAFLLFMFLRDHMESRSQGA